MVDNIGFACTTIFHYIHFKRLSSYFGDQAVFIISTPQFTNERYERLVDYFTKHKVNYCVSDAIISGKVQVAAIVAPYYLPLFSFINPSIPRIRILYGYAKDAWNYADWNKGFDRILVYGPYAQRNLEHMAPTVSIGHPRYKGEGYERDEVYDTDGRSLSDWLHSSKRETLLYCPTWGDLSSFNWFKMALGGLAEKYKIIVKLHHLIVLSSDYNFRHLIDENLFICDETVDLFDLFPVSDLVISDYSGAIFDAILANKRIVLVNSLTAPIKDTGVLNIKKMSNVANLNDNNINQSGSLDIQMREILPSADDPLDLVGIVREALAAPPLDYSALNTDLYSFIDGEAAFRGYQEIERVISQGPINERAASLNQINFNKNLFINFVQQYRTSDFVVWGAGDYGQLIISWLIYNGFKIKAILDVHPAKQGKHLYNIPVYSPENYKFNECERVIVSFLPQDREVAATTLSGEGLQPPAPSYIIPFD